MSRGVVEADSSAEFSAFISVLRTVSHGDSVQVLTHPEPSVSDAADVEAANVFAVADLAAEAGAHGTLDASTKDGAAFREVARALAASESCMTVLGQSTGLMPLAAREVLRAEMARATGLLHLLRFLRGDVSPGRMSVSGHAVVERVLQSVEAERRLRGITLNTTGGKDDLVFESDEALIADMLFGWLISTFTLLEDVGTPEVWLTVEDRAGHLSLSVRQEQAPAPAAWRTRPLDNGWTLDATEVYSAVSLSAGQRMAEAGGGRFTIDAGERSTAISIHLPTLEGPSSSGSYV